MWKILEGSRLCAVLALGAAVLAAAGCGGGGSSQTTASATTPGSTASATSSSPEDAGLITKAEAICSRLNRTVTSAVVPGALDPRKIAAGAPRNAALERAAAEELSRLKAPATMAADWRKIVTYRLTLATELSELARAAQARRTVSITALAASKKRVHQQLSALAKRDGFKACARIG